MFADACDVFNVDAVDVEIDPHEGSKMRVAILQAFPVQSVSAGRDAETLTRSERYPIG